MDREPKTYVTGGRHLEIVMTLQYHATLGLVSLAIKYSIGNDTGALKQTEHSRHE